MKEKVRRALEENLGRRRRSFHHSRRAQSSHRRLRQPRVRLQARLQAGASFGAEVPSWSYLSASGIRVKEGAVPPGIPPSSRLSLKLPADDVHRELGDLLRNVDPLAPRERGPDVHSPADYRTRARCPPQPQLGHRQPIQPHIPERGRRLLYPSSEVGLEAVSGASRLRAGSLRDLTARASKRTR